MMKKIYIFLKYDQILGVCLDGHNGNQIRRKVLHFLKIQD